MISATALLQITVKQEQRTTLNGHGTEQPWRQIAHGQARINSCYGKKKEKFRSRYGSTWLPYPSSLLRRDRERHECRTRRWDVYIRAPRNSFEKWAEHFVAKTRGQGERKRPFRPVQKHDATTDRLGMAPAAELPTDRRCLLQQMRLESQPLGLRMTVREKRFSGGSFSSSIFTTFLG